MAIKQPPKAGLIHKPRVDFNKDRFETIIDQKGYIVYLENAFECPCRTIENDGDYSALSNCVNCGGLGYFYVNKRETKMILSAINLETKYKEWSQEKLGTAKVTALDKDDISFMDRITLKDARSIHKEILEPLYDYDENPFYKSTYDITNIKQVFRYRGPDLDLVRHGDGTEYNPNFTVINGNEIYFNANIPSTIKNANEPYPFKIAIFYEHLPQFYIIDLMRELMTTRVTDEDSQGKIEPKDLPVNAVARRSHFLNEGFYQGIVDNSWLQQSDFDEPC
jgi:hypothetical protein